MSLHPPPVAAAAAAAYPSCKRSENESTRCGLMASTVRFLFDPFGRGGSEVGWHQSGMEGQWAGSNHWAVVGYPTTVVVFNQHPAVPV